jgi:uncharacterized protein
MRKAKWIVLIPFCKNYLAYNPLTNALCQIDQSVVDFLEGKMNSLAPEIIQNLEEGLFLVPDFFNELAYVDHLFYSLKYSSMNLAFTVIPTFYCNMHCAYCYESTTDLNTSMNTFTIGKTIIYILNKIKHYRPLAVDIAWYGGEPLLELDTMEIISNAIQKECAQQNIQYSSYLITNGTLLSKETRNRLTSFKIRGIQITIDGPGEIHNHRRPFKGGEGTFDIILSYIREILNDDRRFKIDLRINIDKENAEYVSDLLKELSAITKNQQQLSISLGQVFASKNPACKSRKDTLFSTRFFARQFLKLQGEIKKLNLSFQPLYLTFNTCIWKSTNSSVIGPRGELYGCWEDVGDEMAIVGDIETGIDWKRQRAIEWVSSTWRTTDECTTCQIAPLCLGGCPRLKKISPKKLENGCLYWRYILPEILSLHAEEIECK